MPFRILRQALVGLLCLAAGAASGDEQLIPVGVKVELTPKLTSHWSANDAERVRGELTLRLARELQDQHPHWVFHPDPRGTRALVLADVGEGVPGEILLRLQLVIDAGAQPFPVSLGDIPLYRPGDFATHGRPPPDEALNLIWPLLHEHLRHRQRSALETLSENVPVAIRPTPIRVPDRELVLPLPRERYGHLRSSVFRIKCEGEGPSQLNVRGRGRWEAYDEALPDALVAKVVDDHPDDTLQRLTPTIIYLLEWERVTDWLAASGGGAQ